jgi:hypothetical protein
VVSAHFSGSSLDDVTGPHGDTVNEARIQALRRDLETIGGVVRAFVEGAPDAVFLVCDPSAAAAPVESAAAAILAGAGFDPANVRIRSSFLSAPAPRRRVRMVDATISRPDLRSATAAARLEWHDDLHEGTASGEGGPGGDLRVCAFAALDALRRIVPNLPEIQLVGVRSVRVFDQDLLVVLLRARTPVEQSLLGASLVRDGEIAPSVVRAVLNAMNRMLGNYLAVGD